MAESARATLPFIATGGARLEDDFYGSRLFTPLLRLRRRQVRKITSSRLNIQTQSANAAAAYTQDERKMRLM
jgi:hypothetical protein